jgi:hypothetical protein
MTTSEQSDENLSPRCSFVTVLDRLYALDGAMCRFRGAAASGDPPSTSLIDWREL